ASRGRRTWRAAWRPQIRANTPDGVAARAALARIADVEQRKSNEMIGAELGYRYDGSPIIWPEAGEGPAGASTAYVPTTWPGAGLPHVWLKDGSALFDQLGPGYTLLRLDRRHDTSALAQALRAAGAPLAVLDLDDAVAREVCGRDLLLL